MKAATRSPGGEWIWIEHNNSLKAMQNAVGGFIECVPNGISKAIIYCDEDGRDKKLPPNFIIQDRFGGKHLICGPVIMLGPVDDDGDTTSLTQELFDKTVSQLEYL